MGLSPGYYSPATRFGYRAYCLPNNPNTGNPEGLSIPSQDWVQKYFYSKAQLKTLLREKRIKGFKFKGQFYVADRPPD
jgi:hypothetical protein